MPSAGTRRGSRPLGLVAAAGLVAWAVAGAGPPAAGAPRLEVVASPALLRLERDAKAIVTISAGAELQDFAVTSNVGRVANLRRVAAERWTAELLPPDETFPQLAIVSAAGRVGPRTVHGWTVVPLWGQGDAVVLSKPFAAISVRIGDHVFGPVRANKAGRALVPVSVPPGVETGYSGSTPVALGVPATLHLHLMVERPQIAATRTEHILVRAYAVTPQGAPREDARIALSSSRGTLGALRAVAPGAFEATLSLAPGPAGPVELSGQLADEPSFVAKASLEVAPGPGEVVSAALVDEPVPVRQKLKASPKLGLLTNFADVTSPYVGAEVALVPAGLRGLGVLVEAGGFAFSNDSDAEPPLRISGRNQYVTAGASVALERELPWRLSYRLAAGGGVAQVSSALRVGEQPAVLQAKWVPAAQLAAGLTWAVWRGGPVAEARVAWYGDPALDNLRGALLSFNALVGYRFELL